MNALHIAASGIVSVVLAVAIYTDIRYGKVYNKLVLPCMAIGLVMWCAGQGWGGFLFSAEGIAVAAIGLVAALLGWLAPGDAKLLLAVGSLMGPHFAGCTVIFGALAGGVIALAVVAKRHLLRPLASSAAVAYGAKLPFTTVWTDRAGYIPYSVPIAIGAAIAGAFPLW